LHRQLEGAFDRRGEGVLEVVLDGEGGEGAFGLAEEEKRLERERRKAGVGFGD